MDKIFTRSARMLLRRQYSAEVAQPHSDARTVRHRDDAGLVSESSSPLIPGIVRGIRRPTCWFLRGHPAHVCTEVVQTRTTPRGPGSWIRTTSTAFDEVQQMSVSALTAAVVLT